MKMKCSVLFLVSAAVYGVSSADRAFKRYPRQVEYAEVGNAAGVGTLPFGPGNYAVPQFGQAPPRSSTGYPGDLSPFLSAAGASEADRKASRQTRRIDGFAPDNFPPPPPPSFRQGQGGPINHGPPSSTVIFPGPTQQERLPPNSLASPFPPTRPLFQGPPRELQPFAPPQRPDQFPPPVTHPRPPQLSSPVTPQRPPQFSVTPPPRSYFPHQTSAQPRPPPPPPAASVQPPRYNGPIPPFAPASSGARPFDPPQPRPDSLSGFDEGRLPSLPIRPDIDIIPQRTQPNFQPSPPFKNEPASAYRPPSAPAPTVVLPTPGQSFRNLRQPINTIAVPPQQSLPAGSPIGAVVAPFPFGDTDDAPRRPFRPSTDGLNEGRPVVRPPVEAPPRPQPAPPPRHQPVAPPPRPQPVPFPRQTPEVPQQEVPRQSHTRRGSRTRVESPVEPSLPTSRSRSPAPPPASRSTVPPPPPAHHPTKKLTLPIDDGVLVPPNRRHKSPRPHSISSPSPPLAPPSTSTAPSATLPGPPAEFPASRQSPEIARAPHPSKVRGDLNPIGPSPPPRASTPVTLPPGVPATYDPANPYPIPRKPLPGPAPPQPLPGNAQLPILNNLPYSKTQQAPELSSLSKGPPPSTSADNHNRRRKQSTTNPVPQAGPRSRSPASPGLSHRPQPVPLAVRGPSVPPSPVSLNGEPNQSPPNRPKNKRRRKNRTRRPTTPAPDADRSTAPLPDTVPNPPPPAGLNIAPLTSPPQSLEGLPPPFPVPSPETPSQPPTDQAPPSQRRGRRRKHRNQRNGGPASTFDSSAENSPSGLTSSENAGDALQDGPAQRGRRVRNRL